MKVFKAIFRIDYPLCYEIVDNLGKQLQKIHENTQGEPFGQVRNQINQIEHSIKSSGLLGEDRFALNLSMKSFDFIVEFKAGVSLEDLAKNQIFKLSKIVIDGLSSDSFKVFNRIGFRTWTVWDRGGKDFDAIRAYMMGLNKELLPQNGETGFQVTDLGLCVEMKNEEDVYSRYLVGPYQKTEEGKYFGIEHDPEEGVIVDVDVWSSKVEIPGFDMNQHVGTYSSYTKSILDLIVNSISSKIGD